MFGEIADAALLASTRAVPHKLLDTGFTFDHADLVPALRALSRVPLWRSTIIPICRSPSPVLLGAIENSSTQVQILDGGGIDLHRFYSVSADPTMVRGGRVLPRNPSLPPKYMKTHPPQAWVLNAQTMDEAKAPKPKQTKKAW